MKVIDAAVLFGCVFWLFWIAVSKLADDISDLVPWWGFLCDGLFFLLSFFMAMMFIWQAFFILGVVR